jgi:putative ABC transport system permease protein
MWDLVYVAIRNVGRNKRRALITMFTVFIGVFVGTGIRGLLNGLQQEIKSGLTRKMHGDIQIHQVGYEDSLETNPYNVLIPYSQEFIQKLKAVDGVEEVTPRLKVMALLNHQKTQTTTPIIISAFTSDSELAVCPRLQSSLAKGKMINSKAEKATVAIEDNNLEEALSLDQIENKKTKESTASITAPNLTKPDIPRAEGYHQLLVTPSLMRGLQAEIGDEVVILLQDKDNMQQAIVAQLVGVVDFAMPGAQMRMAWMDFSTLQSTVGIQDQTSEIAIKIKDKADADRVKADILTKIGSNYSVQTWLELAGFLRDAMTLQNTIFNLVLLIVFSIVISAIVNTSLMTVMERTREIGTLMALGYQRVHIIFLFLVESVVISLVGGVSGISLVGALLYYFNVNGLMFALPGQTAATVLYPSVSIIFVIRVLSLAILSALGASFYPSYRASVMKPVQALTSN